MNEILCLMLIAAYSFFGLKGLGILSSVLLGLSIIGSLLEDL